MITIDNADSFGSNTGVTSVTKSFTVGAGTTMLIADAGWISAGVSGITWNGVSMTIFSDAPGNHRSFWLANPDVGTHDLVVSYGGTTTAMGGVISLKGTKTTTPGHSASATTGDAAGSSATATTSAAAGDLVVLTTYNDRSDVDPFSYTSGTQRWEFVDTGDGATGTGATYAGPTSGVVWSWSSHNTLRSGIAIVLSPGTDISKVSGVAEGSIGKINGLARASIGKVAGLA